MQSTKVHLNGTEFPMKRISNIQFMEITIGFRLHRHNPIVNFTDADEFCFLIQRKKNWIFLRDFYFFTAPLLLCI